MTQVFESVDQGKSQSMISRSLGRTPRWEVSMVFQSYVLFAHLDVRENILFGLKVRGLPAESVRHGLKKPQKWWG